MKARLFYFGLMSILILGAKSAHSADKSYESEILFREYGEVSVEGANGSSTFNGEIVFDEAGRIIVRVPGESQSMSNASYGGTCSVVDGGKVNGQTVIYCMYGCTDLSFSCPTNCDGPCVKNEEGVADWIAGSCGKSDYTNNGKVVEMCLSIRCPAGYNCDQTRCQVCVEENTCGRLPMRGDPRGHNAGRCVQNCPPDQTCNTSCTACTTCGNGTLDQGEECDNPGGSCVSELSGSGTCNEACECIDNCAGDDCA